MRGCPARPRAPARTSETATTRTATPFARHEAGEGPELHRSFYKPFGIVLIQFIVPRNHGELARVREP